MLGWLTRKPDFIVGEKDNPYLLRWYVVPQNRFFNIYLHKFLRDDDDRACHDHPWASLSFASGKYLELVAEPGNTRRLKLHYRIPLLPVFRRSTHLHRITLYRDRDFNPIPIWTIFITGPKIREWGFDCPKGWIPWQQFCDTHDHGNVGRGCE